MPDFIMNTDVKPGTANEHAHATGTIAAGKLAFPDTFTAP